MSLSSLKARSTFVGRTRGMPPIEQALVEGRINLETARQIARVATPETADAWIERASARTVLHLREEVQQVEQAMRLHGVVAPLPPSEDEVRRHRDWEAEALEPRPRRKGEPLPTRRVLRAVVMGGAASRISGAGASGAASGKPAEGVGREVGQASGEAVGGGASGEASQESGGGIGGGASRRPGPEICGSESQASGDGPGALAGDASSVVTGGSASQVSGSDLGALVGDARGIPGGSEASRTSGAASVPHAARARGRVTVRFRVTRDLYDHYKSLEAAYLTLVRLVPPARRARWTDSRRASG